MQWSLVVSLKKENHYLTIRNTGDNHFCIKHFFSIALILQYLALSDIAKEPNSMLEWRIVGICMLILAAFVVSTFIALLVLFKLQLLLDNKTNIKGQPNLVSRLSDSNRVMGGLIKSCIIF